MHRIARRVAVGLLAISRLMLTPAFARGSVDATVSAEVASTSGIGP